MKKKNNHVTKYRSGVDAAPSLIEKMLEDSNFSTRESLRHRNPDRTNHLSTKLAFSSDQGEAPAELGCTGFNCTSQNALRC